MCCEVVNEQYDVYGSSVPLASLLSSAGVIPVLQQLADTFKQSVSVIMLNIVAAVYRWIK